MNLKNTFLIIATLAVAACSNAGAVMEEVSSVGPQATTYKELMDMDLSTDNYYAWLAKDYKALAMFENDEMYDYDSANHFGQKSLAADQGQKVMPDLVTFREINTGYVEEAQMSYDTVIDAYQQEKDIYYPKHMARLQVSYDCWLEQIEENIQPDHIFKCKDMFYDALSQMRGIETTLAIYFENDSYDIIPDEAQKLRAVVSNYKVNRQEIIIEGHTDTTATHAYNDVLSTNRANVVAHALMQIDPSITNIQIQAYGETMLAIPTADETIEPRNRRAIVHFK